MNKIGSSLGVACLKLGVGQAVCIRYMHCECACEAYALQVKKGGTAKSIFRPFMGERFFYFQEQ